ncbi:MAG: pseudouridine synthase [Acidobacteria bacterium]|nr:MAG: pseudouridine synthase [Acidobacteriota bacterium]
MERLQKILSQAGVASRRASEQLMLDGRVSVNGATVRELGTKADAAHDDIRVDGRRVKVAEQHRYLLLNKPRGYVTTRSDPQKRPTVIDLLRGVREYVYPVGRLDFDSEGLLLLTNDGDLAARLTHPRHGVARVYEARVLGVPDAHDLDRLARGLVIDGRRTERAEVRVLSNSLHPSARVYARARGLPARGGGAPRAVNNDATALSPSRSERDGESARGWGPGRREKSRAPRTAKIDDSRAATSATALSPSRRERNGDTLLEITVREGRNRQVRKMCDAIGHPVAHLKRVAIGPLRDGKLKLGHWRELAPEEVRRLRAATDAPTREKEQRFHQE